MKIQLDNPKFAREQKLNFLYIRCIKYRIDSVAAIAIVAGMLVLVTVTSQAGFAAVSSKSISLVAAPTPTLG